MIKLGIEAEECILNSGRGGLVLGLNKNVKLKNFAL